MPGGLLRVNFNAICLASPTPLPLNTVVRKAPRRCAGGGCGFMLLHEHEFSKFLVTGGTSRLPPLIAREETRKIPLLHQHPSQPDFYYP